MKKVILSIDQGTTGTTILLIDQKMKIIGKKNREFKQYYPKLGWVEHDAEEIWESTLKTIDELLTQTQIKPNQIQAIGITNQRETTILWDRKTGIPVSRAIVWQDRRTAPLCEKLKKKELEKTFQDRTGLLLDPYFSGTKIQWMLEHIPGLKSKAKNGEIQFGTIDSWLAYKLSGKKIHVTDVSNASRTLLMNLKTLQWDSELLKILSIPDKILPEIRSSSEIYGTTKDIPHLPDGIPIASLIGDQQSALFGQSCFETGEAKCTYGTGSFILLNTGSKIVQSKNRLLTTVAWKIGNKTSYALEGSAFIAGAAVQWLRDGLETIHSASEIEALAETVPDAGGVIFVPALVGLGAPYWNPEARGTIFGLTRSTRKTHIARATLEGIAFLQADILDSMTRDLRQKLKILKVDGGACANNLLMQFQSDLLNVPLLRPKIIETTALGAALLAGLAIGFWKNLEEIRSVWKEEKRFNPGLAEKERKKKMDRWRKAVQQSTLDSP